MSVSGEYQRARSRYEAIRAREHSERRLQPLLILAYGSFGAFMDVADECLALVAATIQPDNADAQVEIPPRGDTLPELLQSLTVAREALEQAKAKRPDDELIPLPDHVVNFPSCYTVAKLVELMDHEAPMPFAVITAHSLVDYSRHVGMDFIDSRPFPSMFADPGQKQTVLRTRVGFGPITNFTQPSVRARWERSFISESYLNCVEGVVRKAAVVLTQVLDAVPAESLPPIPEDYRASPSSQ